MKRLWKSIPPCLSDVMGFEAILNTTEGVGIVDDSSPYKPLPRAEDESANMGGFGGGRPKGADGGHGGFGGGRPDFAGRGGFGGGKPFHAGSGEERHDRGFGGGRPDFAGHGGRPGHGKKGGDVEEQVQGALTGMKVRVLQTALENEDIIAGSEKKVMAVYEAVKKIITPEFILLCNAPGSSMISSDLETSAVKIEEDLKRPVRYVNLHGDKDYVYGAALTLEMIGKLFIRKDKTSPKSVNILGCNTIDWSEANVADFKERLENAGFSVICAWGAKDLKMDAAAESGNAAVNIVVNNSGLRLARYMKDEFDIPFITGSPFGEDSCRELFEKLDEVITGSNVCDAVIGVDKENDNTDPEAIVIGEQIFANALRASLRKQGYSKVKVLSFFDFDKSVAEPGDKKLTSEDDLKEAASSESIRLIAGNPDYRTAAARDLPWAATPNSGLGMLTRVVQPPMVADKLDAWLAEEINKA